MGTEGHFIFLTDAVICEFLNASEQSFESYLRLEKKRGPKINLYVIQETYSQLGKYRRPFIYIVLHINTTAASMCVCV